MSCRISRSLTDRLVAEAREVHPEETCGLLLGSDGEILDALATANLAADRTAGFEIDPAAHLAASRAARERGLAIVGCYHSHPKGLAAPSDTDIARAWQEDFYWLIVSKDEVRLWRAGTSGAIDRFIPVPLTIESTALQPAFSKANRRPAWAQETTGA